MRGSHDLLLCSRQPVGIIPAHAGLTDSHGKGRHGHGDHPRACGAHDAAGSKTVARTGSSPRMRGSLIELSADIDAIGIIPAHAGLTAEYFNLQLQKRDHPRACGAHDLRLWQMHTSMGSSPRMRGSPHRQILTRRQSGIIPAHAGLTAQNSMSLSRRGDHPRACGAHVRRCRQAQRCTGSSPRMRGSLQSIPRPI